MSDLGETLFAPSTIRMFGRLFTGLTVGELGLSPHANAPLLAALQKLNPEQIKHCLKLARIYGYSYQGNYFKLAEPAVFLVYDEGMSVTAGQIPIPMDEIGVELKDEVFASEIRMWTADGLDMGVRIDISIGWMKELLLNDGMAPADNVTGGQVTGRADVVSRADLVGRADIVGRADVIGGSRRR